MRILIVDDEESMRTLIGQIVEDDGHTPIFANDGLEALELLECEQPDLAILDVMLPRMDGFALCARVRESGHTFPILFLTAKGDIVDKSIGFKSGGDDYLVKPFAPRELTLRIEALARRRPSSTPPQTGQLVCGDLNIDLVRRRVTLRGEPVDLTPKEFQILAILASSPGEVYTRKQLIEDAWGKDYYGEPAAITVFIRRIREKIEDDPARPRYVKTVWRIGYLFCDPNGNEE
jgi:two-component system response regulator VicR